jgi:hypothetical protein
MAGTPEQVWQVLTDFPEHAVWNPLFASISGTARVGERLKVVMRKGDGTGFSFTPILLNAEAGRLLRWKGKLLVTGLMDGTHEFELTPIGVGRTRLDHREAFGGLLVPFLGKVFRETHAGFVAFDAALAKRVATVYSLKVGV